MYLRFRPSVLLLASLVEVNRGWANTIDGRLAQLMARGVPRLSVPVVVICLELVVMHMHRGAFVMLFVVHICGPDAVRRLLTMMKFCLLALILVVVRLKVDALERSLAVISSCLVSILLLDVATISMLLLLVVLILAVRLVSMATLLLVNILVTIRCNLGLVRGVNCLIMAM